MYFCKKGLKMTTKQINIEKAVLPKNTEQLIISILKLLSLDQNALMDTNLQVYKFTVEEAHVGAFILVVHRLIPNIVFDID